MIERIRKRDGRIVLFDKNKIAEAIWKAAQSVGGKDRELAYKLADQVVELLEKQLKPGEIPNVEQVQDLVEKVLVENGHYKTAKAYITYRKKKEEIRNEKIAILQGFYEEEVAKKFSLNALRLMASRYLLKNEEGKLIEGPKQLFQRVAMLIVIPDLLYDNRIFDKDGKQNVKEKEEFDPIEYEGKLGFKTENEFITWNRYHLERMKNLYDELNSQGKMKVSWREFLGMLERGEFQKYHENYLEYFNLMVTKKFLPNSPTLFNAGTRLGQLSACFVIGIEDDMESIMEAAKDAAIIFKSGGGIGINYSKLRPEGDIVASTSGVASGPVSFMRIIDVVTDVVKQGGCISANSFLRTTYGLNYVNELSIPFKIEGATREFVFDGNDFSHIFLGSLDASMETIKLKTETGNEIEGSYDELIAYINKDGEIDFKPLYKVNENDYLVLVRGGHLGKKIKLKKIESLHFNANKVKVPEYFDENFAEILGFYMADGCWNRGRLILTFNKKEKGLIEHFKELIKKTFNLDIGYISRKESYIDVVWYSRALEKYFDELGIKKTSSPNAFIPLIVRGSEEGVVAAFLRGVFEGDGSVNSYGYPVLYSSSEKFVKETQQLLLSMGIVSKIRRKEIRKNRGHFGKRDMFTLLIVDEESIKEFIEKIGFISEEKNEKVKKVLSKSFERNGIIPNQEKRLRKIYEELKKENKKIAYRFYRKTYKYMTSKRNFTFKSLRRLEEEFPILKEYYKDFKNKYFVKVKEISKSRSKVAHFETSSGLYVANGFLVHNKRRGANMGILESWHPDILKFIHAKEKEGQFENFNISVMLDEKFWEAYEKGEKYALINPRNGKAVNYIDPKFLLNEIATLAWRTADPGVLFLDNINRRNVQKEARGLIRATNPCGEQPLYEYESCNLGSINLYAFIKFDENRNAYFDWEDYKKTIEVAYKFLDNVIDVNKYPVEKIEKASKNVRRIGLGYMGLADTLFALKIPYNSEEGFKFIEKVSEFLTYHAMLSSVERAKERGVFPYYELTSYKKGEMPLEGFYHQEAWSLDWNKLRNLILQYGIRNVEVTSVAPTGSISMFFDVSSGIEPQFSLVYEKRVTVGSFFYTDIEFERQLKERGLYNDEILKKISENGGSLQGLEELPEDMRKVFVTALDIPWWDHIRAQSVAQLWITTSISKTINMPSFSSVEDVLQAYITAYKMGCKGITIYREGSKSKQVLYAPSQAEEKRIVEVLKLIKNDTVKIMKRLGIGEPRWVKELSEKGEISKVGNNNNGKIEKCPVCGSTRLVYQAGCVTCLDCGWSACLIS